MPTDFDDDLDEDAPDQPGNDVRRLREHIKKLEQDAKAAREKAAGAERLPELERELAFRRAGIDPEDPKAKWLVKGYDGELSPDAIKAAAAEAGLTGQRQSATGDQDADLDAEVRRMDRTSRASTGRNPDEDSEFDAEMARAARDRIPEHEFDQILIRYGRMDPDALADGSNTNFWI